MNEYLVIVLDGAFYLVGALLLTWLAMLCPKFFRRRAEGVGFLTALLCVLLVLLIQNQVPVRLLFFFPQWDALLVNGIALALALASAIAMAYWRFRLTALQAALTGTLVALAVIGLFQLVPLASARLLPSGPRLKDVIADAEERTRKAREAAAKFKTVNEAAPSVVAVALDAMSQLTTKQEFESLKTQFREGTKFLAERKALMDAMTPQEREEYRKEMSAFLKEQGIAQDRYSLAALKNAKLEDVHNLVAFMREMNATLPKTETPVTVRPPSESLQIILRNVQGLTFSKEDHEAMATLSNLFFKEGPIPAIARAKAELQNLKINPAWAGTFMAAAMETASGVPAEVALENPDTLLAPAPPPPSETPTVRVVTYVNLSTHYGYLRMPTGTRGLREMVQAANQIPVSGILAVGNTPERSRVSLGRTSAPIGGTYKVSQGTVTYRFRFDKIMDGQVYVICDNIDPPPNPRG